LIGEVLYNSLSEFTDTVRSLYTANGDPNVSSWKYKIAIKDTCGNISALSLYHKTLFTQNNSGNFSWNDYQIEGDPIPVPALSNYLFQRDNSSNGTWSTIATLSASSTAFTDPAYATYQAMASWRAITAWTINCTPTRTLISTTRSNIKHNAMVTGIAKDESRSVKIYPNPANESITIELEQQAGASTIKIINVLGQLMEEEMVLSASSTKTVKQINVKKYAKGIYTVCIETNGKKVFRKLVVN
jgi:hypothetical protein